MVIFKAIIQGDFFMSRLIFIIPAAVLQTEISGTDRGIQNQKISAIEPLFNLCTEGLLFFLKSTGSDSLFIQAKTDQKVTHPFYL